MTAEDFVYTWQRIVDPKTASEYAYLVSDAHVLNAEDEAQKQSRLRLAALAGLTLKQGLELLGLETLERM